MEIIRKDYLCNYIYAPFSYLVNIRNSVGYEGGENIPEKGPALLLSKHQYFMDIFLEADFLMNKKNRFGNWVMKSTLPEFLKYFGAVKIMREKDRVKQGMSRKDFFSYNQEVDEYLKFLCGEGEIVIVHPEGTRVRNNMGKIKDGLINNFRRVEEELGIQIPVIPIGIEYESLSNDLGSKIHFRVGPSLNLQDSNLVDIVREEIQRLSGL